MGKRHTKQNHKQKMGQYFTTKSSDILSGYEFVVDKKIVIDPFAGEWDLLNWARENGCHSVLAYDLEPKNEYTIQNDSLINPPDYSDKILITNPPYLSSNKNKSQKIVYEKWKQNDLYKCHIASLKQYNCSEGLLIIPSNFLCESSPNARKLLFGDYYIVSGKYWNEPVFDDATTGICVIHFKRGRKEKQEFPLLMLPENKNIKLFLEKRYNYLNGKDFFDYISDVRPIVDIIKTDIGMNPPNTNIVVSLLEHGKWEFGLSYNNGDPLFCRPKSFTTYQLTIPSRDLTPHQQKEIVRRFQLKLHQYKEQYDGLFLSNFMGANQKILSRRIVKLLFSKIYNEVIQRESGALSKFL